MSKTSQPSSNRWLFRLGIGLIVGLLLLARIGYGQNQAAVSQQAVLQGSIQVQPVKPVLNDKTGKVQPGTPVKLSVAVENKGTQASPSGEIYVRYAFAKPLENESTSVIFETEKLPLPPIEPGKSIHLTFNTPHPWPSVLDFVRYDWPMREYQALAVIDGTEQTIGTLAITFSAYYYPGIRKELPTEIKDKKQENP